MQMQVEQKLNFYIFRLDGRQWGANPHGWAAFPVAFTSFRRILTNHQGTTFMQSKVVEVDSLTGFTLDVDTNSSENYDAQWIAIGR